MRTTRIIPGSALIAAIATALNLASMIGMTASPALALDDPDTVSSFHGSATVTTPYGSTFGALYSPQITPAFQDREYVLRLRDVGYMLYAIGASYDHICVATEVIYYRLNVTIAFPGSIPAAPIHLELVPSSPLVAEEIEFVPLISEYKRVSIPVVDLETETFKIRVEPATDPGACSIN